MMDVVLQELDVRSTTEDADANWRAAPVPGAVIADLQALNPDVALVLDENQTAAALGNQLPAVQNGLLAGIAAEGDESAARVAGHVDRNALLVLAGCRRCFRAWPRRRHARRFATVLSPWLGPQSEPVTAT